MIVGISACQGGFSMVMILLCHPYSWVQLIPALEESGGRLLGM